ncbi:MAG: PAAR domain-containing protein [Clostridiales bacterium]|nr:PAAR domain-containing protein [Clostridiales bacterium]
MGDGQSHGGVQSEGSSTVFVNGRGIARVGDFTSGEPPPPVMHGDNPQATGSPNVFAN